MIGNILIIDDEPAALKLLRDILAADGHVVRPFTSGELALRSVRIEAPELILLDIRMPGMDGFEICRRIKKNPLLKDIPVIFISAASDLEDKVRAFREGGVDYISKPFQKEEVLARARTHIALSQTLRKTRKIAEAYDYARAHIQAILDNVPESVLTLDENGLVQTVNAATSRLFGYEPEALAGKSVNLLVPDFFGGEPAGHGQSRFPGAGPREATGKRKDGTAFSIDLAVSEFFFEGRRHFIGIIRDITDRKQVEHTLRRWGQIFERAGWGVAVGSADGTSLEIINPAFAAMHGYTIEELTGRPILDVFAPEVRGEIAGHMELAHERGHYRYESLHIRRDGSTFPVLIDVTAVRNDEGEVLYRIANVQDISDLKQAENALRQREALLSQMLELLPVGVWLTDGNGVIIRNNPAGEQIWMGARRVGPEQYGEYKGWWADSGKRIEPEEWALARALSRGETSIGEVIDIECFDGTRKTILNSAMPLRGPGGEIVGAIAVNEDITASHRVQEELRLSKELFQHAFEFAAIGVAICDPDGRFLMVNDALSDIVGYSEDELLMKSFRDITHPDDLDADASQAARVLAGEIPSYQMEKRYIHSRGHVVWVFLGVALVRDGHGAPLYFVGQIIDITARKNAEESLHASQKSLANAQRIAHIGDWEWDVARGVTYWSEEIYRIRGFDPAKNPASQELFLSTVYPDDVELVQQSVQQALYAGHFYGIDYRIIRPDGAVRFVHSQGEVTCDDQGRPVKMVGTTQDVTERKEIEQELIASRQQLRDLAAHRESVREEERKRIAREVHDELGQLLTALKMDVSLLRMRFGDNPDILERTEAMRQLVEKTVRVVRHVASNLRPSTLNLGIVPALEWLAESFSQRTGIPCVVEFDDENIVLADSAATAVFRIVQEALTNVTRHARASRVEITFELAGATVRLRVRDDGCGFVPEVVASQTSFGLLGIRERALMLGGEFSLSSAPGKGTTISVEIPLHNRSIS